MWGTPIPVYVPKVDEPSVFSGKEGVVNADWVKWGIQALLGLDVMKGSKNFDALQEFLEERVAIIKDGKGGVEQFITNSDPDKHKIMIGERTLVRMGGEIQHRIRKFDLDKVLDREPYPFPDLIKLPSGLISLRWVITTARTDKMTPEEAYTYALALTRGC